MSGPRPDGQHTGDELWIAQGRVVEDGSVEAAVAGDDQIHVVRRIARDVLLLEMGEVQADRLKATFGDDLLIERDRPVPEPRQPFDL